MTRMQVLGEFDFVHSQDRGLGSWRTVGTFIERRFCWQGIRSALGRKLDRSKKYQVRVYRGKPRGDSISMFIKTDKVYRLALWGGTRPAMLYYRRPSGRWTVFRYDALFYSLVGLFDQALLSKGVKVYLKVNEI